MHCGMPDGQRKKEKRNKELTIKLFLIIYLFIRGSLGMRKKRKFSQCPHQLQIFPLLSTIPHPPTLLPCCSKAKVTEIFEIIKRFGWVNLEWVKLLEKNLKDCSGMQSCYINIFWMVPSYAQPWRHNCIKWNFIQKLWKCTGVGWLSVFFCSLSDGKQEAKVLEKKVDSAKRFPT